MLFYLMVCLVIFMILILIFSCEYKKSNIPKFIWTYWHDGNIPITVRKCIATWKKHNPEYEITILNNNKVKKLCGIDLNELNIQKDFHARYADFARILVIRKFGGIWIDSSIICTQNFNWLHTIQRKTNSDIICYYAPMTTDMNYPILENWFFAAPKESKFMNDWVKESLFMLTFKSESDYIEHIKYDTNIDLQNLEESLPYLIMHLCALVVQHRRSYNMYFMNSLDGPFKYLSDNDWTLPDAFDSLCKNKTLQTSLVKLRGYERSFVENKKNEIKCDKNMANESIYSVLV